MVEVKLIEAHSHGDDRLVKLSTDSYDYGLYLKTNGDLVRIESWNNEEAVSLDELAAHYCETLDMEAASDSTKRDLTIQMLRREIGKVLK